MLLGKAAEAIAYVGERQEWYDADAVAAVVGDYENRIVKVWDITGDAAREKASLKGAAVPSRVRVVENATGIDIFGQPGTRPLRVSALGLAPEGRAVALADADGTIQVWSLAESEPRLRATLPGHKEERVMGAVQGLAFSADGQRLVTVGSDRKLMVWDIAGGKAVYAASFPDILYHAGFAPDGRHVVTKNPDGTIYFLRLPRSP